MIKTVEIADIEIVMSKPKMQGVKDWIKGEK